jgi:hypothetical protein
MMSPDISKKQAEFFAILIWLAVLTAVAILIIDFQIKGAILDQAVKLREAIHGQVRETAASQRFDNNGANHAAYPSDMVSGGHARMETPGAFRPSENNDNTVNGRDETDGRSEFDSGEIPRRSE